MPKGTLCYNVRLTTVDNFQGEENDIILLSLVRSNKEGKIGFLKTENRVCVALSRAKVGLIYTKLMLQNVDAQEGGRGTQEFNGVDQSVSFIMLVFC